MKAETLQIIWHSKEPVFSLDFSPDGRLITAGGDKEIKVWNVAKTEDGCDVNHVCTLTGHSKTINCVRVSPTGEYLVSCGDGGEIILWQPAKEHSHRLGNLSNPEHGTPTWKRITALRGHNDDVMDACWSTDGSALVTGSIDNRALIFDVSETLKGQPVAQLSNHKHFIQGVSWDPAQQFIATQSADRTCKIWSLKPPAAGRKKQKNAVQKRACKNAKDFYCSHTIAKMEAGNSRQPIFLDETIPTFFRRLSWSPDGSFVVFPAGRFQLIEQNAKAVDVQNTAYIYARGHWKSPIMHLPGHGKPVVAVKFCPLVFEKGHTQSPSMPEGGPARLPENHPLSANIPYKMIFAVATLDSVVLYDTESFLPLAVLGSLHYDSITDIAWSTDGQYLAVSSRDCYCSIARFEPEEFGIRRSCEDMPEHIAQMICAGQKRSPREAQGPMLQGRKRVMKGNREAECPVQQSDVVPVACETKDGERKKRIQPEPVDDDTNRLEIDKGEEDASAYVTPWHSDKVRRITPTLLPSFEKDRADFLELSKESIGAPVLQGEKSRDAVEGSNSEKKRRITPIPVAVSKKTSR